MALKAFFVRRLHGKHQGDHWLYTEEVAQARGINYIYWREGLYEAKFLMGQDNWVLIDETYDDKGTMIFPPLVAEPLFACYDPTLYVKYDYIPRDRLPRFVLGIATKWWWLYETMGHSKFFLNPDKMTAEFKPSQVRSITMDFKKGFSEKNLEFMLEYKRQMLDLSLTPGDAALEAYKKIYGKPSLKNKMTGKQNALLHLKLCSIYIETGVEESNTIAKALQANEVDHNFLVGELKDILTDKDNHPNARIKAADRLAHGVEQGQLSPKIDIYPSMQQGQQPVALNPFGGSQVTGNNGIPEAPRLGSGIEEAEYTEVEPSNGTAPVEEKPKDEVKS